MLVFNFNNYIDQSVNSQATKKEQLLYLKSDNVNFIAYSFQNEKYERNAMLISSDNNCGVYLLQKVEMWDET